MAVTQQRLRAFTSMTYTKPFMTIVVGTWTGPDLDRGPGPEVRKVRDLAAGPGPAATFLRC